MLNICLWSLSPSVQPRRGGHILVHHPEGLCQCGHLWQGVWLCVCVCMNAFILLHAYVSFCDKWALFNCSASSDAISCVSKGLKCAADHVCMEQTSIVCPVGLENTSGGVWQTLLSSPWLITMIKWLKGIVRIHNFTPHMDFTIPVQADELDMLVYVPTHWSHVNINTCTLHIHGQVQMIHPSPEHWFFSPGLRMTSKLFSVCVLFLRPFMRARVCVCVLGCRVHAPWGWWLWEVGPGYRFASCSLHRPERG